MLVMIRSRNSLLVRKAVAAMKHLADKNHAMELFVPSGVPLQTDGFLHLLRGMRIHLGRFWKNQPSHLQVCCMWLKMLDFMCNLISWGCTVCTCVVDVAHGLVKNLYELASTFLLLHGSSICNKSTMEKQHVHQKSGGLAHLRKKS